MAANSGKPADIVFTGGAVYTVDEARPWAEAVAVRDGRIVAVGADNDVRDLIGRTTELHDLRGRMLLPGFQDAHIHAPSGGLSRLQCDLSDVFSSEEYLRVIRVYAEAHPDLDWIIGDGWSMDAFPGGTPSAEELDAVVPDRPAFLPNRDGHGAWVNSRALGLAGITRETPDPPDGRIERTTEGEPQGTLHEGAMSLVERLTPPITRARWEEAIRIAQTYLHSLGITAWQEAIVGGSYDTFGAYRAMAERGELTARVVAALWWDRHRGEEQVEELVELRARGTVGRLRASTVKIMQDGVVENFTAGVLEPYFDADGKRTDGRGLSFIDPEPLKGYVTRLDRGGFQVHFHAIGERAVREALNALEAARVANGPSDNRHHIAHIQVIHPDDLPRFAELDVVANAQPLWATLEGQMVHLTIPFLGPERARWQYPFRSLARSGARLAFGSDWNVSSPNPMWEMHVAVHRKVPKDLVHMAGGLGAEEPLTPEECLDLPTAIAAFTTGSAYVNHLDRDTGSIEVGKLADLVVLDRNLFDVDPEGIYEAEVQLTLVEGERVFEAPGSPDPRQRPRSSQVFPKAPGRC